MKQNILLKNKMKGGVEQMEKKQINKTIDVYVEKCSICGQEIKGTSEGMTNHNLMIHMLTQHKVNPSNIQNAKQ